MTIQRKILCIISSIFALVLFLGNLPLFAAHEAHVINVKATIKMPVWKILVTKVYYDVDSEHGFEGVGGSDCNEWVEIYNSNEWDINLKEWQICDNQTCVVISDDDLFLPAGGFAVISRNQSTWDYWTIPGDVLKIALENAGNFYLANTGDRVILKNNNGIEVDAMSYGNDTYAFNPSCPCVDEGHMLGRVPLDPGPGFEDTDTSADWRDYALPSVVVTYPSVNTVWNPGYHTIRWTAVNPNGPDSDLDITILYIRDTNRNGRIDPYDAVSTIYHGANTGSYTGYFGFYGYLWFKVIAVGPENFMINDYDMSGRVYDPPASEDEDYEPEYPETEELEENLVGNVEDVAEDIHNGVWQEMTEESVNLEETNEIIDNETGETQENEILEQNELDYEILSNENSSSSGEVNREEQNTNLEIGGENEDYNTEAEINNEAGENDMN